MTMLKRLLSMIALLALAACGGSGGGDGGSPFGGPVPGGGDDPSGGSAAAVADVDVQLSSPTIPNSGTGTVTATVTALDANRNAISGAAVTLAANNGAVLTITGTAGSVTDSTGRIVATVGIGSDQTNRDITVSATSGSVSKTAILQVVDAPAPAVPTSIEVLSSVTTVGTGGDGVQIRAFVKDANNNALPSTSVSFRSDTGTLSSVTAATDESGAATATFAAGLDRTNRSALITVSAGAVSGQLTLPITGTRLTLSGPSSMILGTSSVFDLLATDSKGSVIPGVTVTAASQLGNPVSSGSGTRTDANGQIRFAYDATKAGTDSLVFAGGGATVSPNPALVVSGDDFAFLSPAAGTTLAVGAAQEVQVRLRRGGAPLVGTTISFAATAGTLTPTTAVTDAAGIAKTTLSSPFAGPVTVQAVVAGGQASATLPLVVVATTPATLVLQITPTATAPNVGVASNNQVQVVAKVRDAGGSPVPGLTVNFTRDADPSGGNLLQATAVTDSDGQARVAYRSGAESTANNGVVLRGSVAGLPAVTGTASLTVNQSALFIALGTGNVITNLDEQTYRKDWVVYVTDANGIPVDGATLTIKSLPAGYLTGRLLAPTLTNPVWHYGSPIYSCASEDLNEDGIKDPGEDVNGDGLLWPGNVIAVTPGIVQTVNGRATVSLVYAESYVPWVTVRLTASATVAGTESRNDAEFIVDGLASDFNKADVPPAAVVSPFGLSPKPGAICTRLL